MDLTRSCDPDADQLIGMVTDLTKLLCLENEALTAMDFPRAANLFKAKYNAADRLDAARRSAKFVYIPPKLIRELAGQAEQNRRLLKGAMSVHSRALDNIRRVTGAVTPARVKTSIDSCPATHL